tara:strand:+ start:3381 stop:4673 length:1293 start_codon:yes stop_codon:yes gene_type:complete
MSVPVLTPSSNSSKVILPITGTADNVNAAINPLPFGFYMQGPDAAAFAAGAADQVSFVYKKLGGDVLDVEMTQYNVYAAYEEAVLEYSYLVNIHQAKNSLNNLLGATTASFDEDGQIVEGDPLSGSNSEMALPRYTFDYTRRVAEGIATEAGAGGGLTYYTASFVPTASQQDYDLQQVVSSSVESGDLTLDNGDTVGNNKIIIRNMYYKTPRSMWRFFAYYGGLNVIGNMSTYGQYADDSTFEVIPTWQNKLQAMMYEDSIYTRTSHYSYEIINNKLRLFPTPGAGGYSPERFYFRFTVKKDATEEYSDRQNGSRGVNNINNLPFQNIPYSSINSIGKQWIRRFALALCKEVLGQIRGKLSGVIPLPGGSVTLNSTALLSEASKEMSDLRTELKTVLDELTYENLLAKDANMTKTVTDTLSKVPVPLFVG